MLMKKFKPAQEGWETPQTMTRRWGILAVPFSKATMWFSIRRMVRRRYRMRGTSESDMAWSAKVVTFLAEDLLKAATGLRPYFKGQSSDHTTLLFESGWYSDR